MLPFALAVIGWQVWTVADRKPSTFLLSYWFVNWDHGFIRRGLLGELNQLWFGDDLLTGAYVLMWICGGISAACAAGVALALLHRGSPLSIGLGWLILISPYTIKGLLTFARPDQLPIPMLIILAVGLAGRPRASRAFALLGAVGVVFGVLVLAHEGAVLTMAPWMLVIVVWFSRDLGPTMIIARSFALFAIPAAVTAVVVLRGAATAKQITLLAADAKPVMPKGENMITYLGDTTRDSFELVGSFGTANLVSMAVVGLVLALLHLVALAIIPGSRLRMPRPVAIVVLGTVLPAFVLQMAMAKDWQRWFGLWVAMGLLSYGLVLVTDRTAPIDAGPGRWTPQRMIAFVLVTAILFPVPRAAANTRYPCTWQYIAHEAPFPYQRAIDLVTGERRAYDYLGGCRR